MKEAGTNPTVFNSASSTNNSTSQTWTPTTGRIDGAGSFNGSSNSININSADSLNPASITVSAWVNADVNNKWQYVAVKSNQWHFGRDNAGKYYLGVWSTAGLVTDAHSVASATTATWEHVVFTYNGIKAKYYVNTTVVIDDDVSNNLQTTDNAVNIGSQGGDGNFWDGLIDEVKIANTVRSAGWIATEYNNQNSPATFMATGDEESAPLPNTTPSLPTIDNYNDGSWVTDNTPTLQFDLSDSDAGDIVKYQLQIADNESFTNPLVDTTEGTGEASPRNNVTYTPAALDDSSYYWRVRAIDDEAAESNWTTANSGDVAFGIDTAAPTVEAGSNQTRNASFTQNATASDATSDIASYLWTKQSGPGTITFGTAMAEDTTISASQDGTYVIRLAITDIAGNSAYDEVTLEWDTSGPGTPSASPSAGTYTSAQSVTLSSINGNIYYTLDSSEPTASSTLYVSAITVNESKTIKAIAIDTLGNESGVLSAQYVINIPSDNPGNNNTNSNESNNNNANNNENINTNTNSDNDVSALKVSQVKHSADEDSITIEWQTNHDADSLVEYGKNIKLNKDKRDKRYEQKHKTVLENLDPDTRYYFKITSEDPLGNKDSSKRYSVKTDNAKTEKAKTSADLISNPFSNSLSQLSNANDNQSENNPQLTISEETKEKSISNNQDAGLNIIENQKVPEVKLAEKPVSADEPPIEYQSEIIKKDEKKYLAEAKFRIVNENDYPIVGIPVTLHSDPKTTITDENGIATFNNVEIGKHEVAFDYEGENYAKKVALGNASANVGEIKIPVLTVKAEKNGMPIWGWMLVVALATLSLYLFIKQQLSKNS